MACIFIESTYFTSDKNTSRATIFFPHYQRNKIAKNDRVQEQKVSARKGVEKPVALRNLA